MPGLRYFDSIIPKERKIRLKQAHINTIKTKRPLQFVADF